MTSRQLFPRGIYLIGLVALAVAGLRAAEPSGTSGRAWNDYVLQPGDLLRVQVFQQEELTSEVRISQNYAIKLPLIETVDLRGLTLREAQEKIRELYDRDYLVNPQVTVLVTEYVKRTVNVLGQVNDSGQVEFPPEQGMTLLDAVSKAGGFTRLADRRKVTLTRIVNGQSVSREINTQDIIEGKAEDIPLQKDDMINVPERVF